jgi:RimJ/RimL family protein N-acetyltransferase
MTESLRTSTAGPGRFPSMDWTIRLAPISNGLVTLREVAARDAGALLAQFNSPAVRRHMAPPPATLDGFERFIRWTQLQRRSGALACFAIMPGGARDAAGIVQIWRVEPDFSTAEWGIVLGENWWGRGIGQSAARLLFTFAFDTLKVRRLEARLGPENQRGKKLMSRLGASRLRPAPSAAQRLSDGGLSDGGLSDGGQKGEDEVWTVHAATQASA